MNILDKFINPRLWQRIQENPCSVCKKVFSFQKDNDVLMDGFIDSDTSELVHFNCKTEHYERKRNSIHNGKYSESPLTIQFFELFDY